MSGNQKSLNSEPCHRTPNGLTKKPDYLDREPDFRAFIKDVNNKYKNWRRFIKVFRSLKKRGSGFSRIEADEIRSQSLDAAILWWKGRYAELRYHVDIEIKAWRK